MLRRITPQTTLDNLRREAKRRLKELRAGAPPHPALRDVQHALAREYGFSGWVALKAAVESAARDRERAADPTLVARFIDYACPDHHVRGRPAHRIARHAALRILDAHPDMAHANLATAIVCGEIEDVDRAGDFSSGVEPKGWQPLLYLCFARVASPRATDNAVAIARMLLDRGADPNTWFMAGESRYTPLVGVAGEGEEDRPPHAQRDALARRLLEHGAEPYDTQVIYNLGFHGNVLWFLKLIHEFSTAAGRESDWDDPEWHMLDMGAYGTGARWHLRIAVEHNDLELAEWCLSHGANANAAPERDPRLPQRSLYAHASLLGHDEMARLLTRYGAIATTAGIEAEDFFVAACMRLDREQAMRLAGENPVFLRSTKAMFAAARQDRADVVELLLEMGVQIESEDQQKRRALHVAAGAGALRVAQLLIERGAEIDPVETEWRNTPLDFAVHHEHVPMIELLSRHSRDIWNLTFTGKLQRLRDILSATPQLATLTSDATPLFWLPESEETALEIAQLLVSHGADPAFRRSKDGMTAADIARRRGMDDVAEFLEKSAAKTVSFQQVALDLVAAHDAGDPAALKRLEQHYGRALTQEDVRAMAWSRVYALRQRSGAGGDRRLDVSEARELVAREEGFGNWTAFIAAVAAGRPAPGRAWEIDRSDNTIRPRRVLKGGEWASLLDLMKEQHITSLEANGQIDDDMLGRVAALGHVTRLDLEGSRQITDDGLQQLGRMPQLVELNLTGCVLSDRALTVLRHLPNLRRFQMRWQKGITDAGAENLAFCDEIEIVDLAGTATGDGAIRALAGKPKLRRFKSGRLVTDEGLRTLHHFPVFKEWRGGEPRYSLMDSDAEPNQLLLDGPFTNAGVASLAGLDGLFALSFFWNATAITRDAFAPLAQLPNLGFLGCEGTLCDDKAMRDISGIPQLRMLIAQGTVATDEGFIALSRSRTLEYLWGRECPNLTGRGFAALSRMPSLRGLGVSCKAVDDAALATLPNFPSLRELMPMDVNDGGFRHVGTCEQLEILWCMYCRQTTDAATEHIKGLSKLKTYYAGKTRITDASLEILANMQSLERLTFWETANITDDGIRLLKRLPRLTELNLEGLGHVTADVAGEFPPNVRVRYAP